MVISDADNLSSLYRANTSPLLVVDRAEYCSRLVLSSRVFSSRHTYNTTDFTAATKKMTLYLVSQTELLCVSKPHVKSYDRPMIEMKRKYN